MRPVETFDVVLCRLDPDPVCADWILEVNWVRKGRSFLDGEEAVCNFIIHIFGGVTVGEDLSCH